MWDLVAARGDKRGVGSLLKESKCTFPDQTPLKGYSEKVVRGTRRRSHLTRTLSPNGVAVPPASTKAKRELRFRVVLGILTTATRSSTLSREAPTSQRKQPNQSSTYITQAPTSNLISRSSSMKRRRTRTAKSNRRTGSARKLSRTLTPSLGRRVNRRNTAMRRASSRARQESVKLGNLASQSSITTCTDTCRRRIPTRPPSPNSSSLKDPSRRRPFNSTPPRLTLSI